MVRLYATKIMLQMRVAFLILSWLCFAASVNFDCPYTACPCYITRISCENLGMEELPTLVTLEPTVNTILDLDDNSITIIPRGRLPSGLVEISLQNNPVTTIDEAAFNGSSSTLQMLSFSNAKFIKIPDAFLHLNSLSYLSIHNTNIQDWNENAMKHIGTTVANLDLENVGLISWPVWIQYFSHLNELSLTGSTISSLPDDALNNQINILQTLSLINNKLTAVPVAVSKLQVLQMLNLINSSISDLTYLPQASKLTSLSLDNTSLSDHIHVSNTLKPFAQSLTNVYLEGNHLAAIPDLSFMTKLGSIVLANNQITNSTSGSMPSSLFDIDIGYNKLPSIPAFLSSLQYVTSLVLPWNKITSIQGKDFPPGTTEVDLSFNLISELTDTSFPTTSKIMQMNLNGNPIVRISNFAFNGLQSLSDLTMQDTKLTRLPLDLSSMKNLKLLDLTGSGSLICTCLESSLRLWILGLSTIHGNCGQMTINYFYSNMSLSCPNR